MARSCLDTPLSDSDTPLTGIEVSRHPPVQPTLGSLRGGPSLEESQELTGELESSLGTGLSSHSIPTKEL